MSITKGAEDLYEVVTLKYTDERLGLKDLMLVYSFEKNKLFTEEVTLRSLKAYSTYNIGLNSRIAEAINTYVKLEDILEFVKQADMPTISSSTRGFYPLACHVEANGELQTRIFNMETLDILETKTTGTPSEKVFNQHKKRLFICPGAALLITATDDRKVEATRLLQKRVTNTVHINAKVGQKGTSVVYNKEHDTFYALTDINGKHLCYCNLESISNDPLWYRDYPIQYDDGNLLLYSQSRTKTKTGTSYFMTLDLGGTAEPRDLDDFDGVPMLDGFFIRAEYERLAEDAKINVYQEDAMTLNSDALTLYGSDVERPLVSGNGNLCGYSKEKTDICNLQGVQRIDTDLPLAKVDYKGLVLDNSLKSIQATQLGTSGFSSSIALLANGVKPDVLIDMAKLNTGKNVYTIFIARLNYSIPEIVEIINKLGETKIMGAGSPKVVIVDSFKCKANNKGDSEWFSVVDDVEQPIFVEPDNTNLQFGKNVLSRSGINLTNCLLRVVTRVPDKDNTATIEGVKDGSGSEFCRYLQKEMAYAQQDTLNDLLSGEAMENVSLTVRLLNRGDLYNEISDESFWLAQGIKPHIFGEAPLVRLIAGGSTDFISNIDGNLVVFELSCMKLKQGIRKLEQRQYDLLNAIALMAVSDSRNGLKFLEEYNNLLKKISNYSDYLEKQVIRAVKKALVNENGSVTLRLKAIV